MVKKYLYFIIIISLAILSSCGESLDSAVQTESEVQETNASQFIPQRPLPQTEPDTVENFAYYLDEKIPEEVREIVLTNRSNLFVSTDPDFTEHPEKYLYLDYDETIDLNIVKILEEADSIPQPLPYIPLDTIEKELDFLMDYLKYYYGAYTYYGGDELFLPLKEVIMSELKESNPETITSLQYTDVLYTHLSNAFIDCHFGVGNRYFSDIQRHRYFLRNTDYRFHMENGNFYTEIESKTYELISVNSAAPSQSLLSYLNEEGVLIWIVGHSSASPLTEKALIELYHEPTDELLTIEAPLTYKNSSLKFDNAMYHEYEVSGIQIVECRRCQPLASEENMDYLMAESGENLRDKNLIVVDIRNNTGGSDMYPKLWLSALFDEKIGTPMGVFTSRRTRTVHSVRSYNPDISYEDFAADSKMYPGWSDPRYGLRLPNENKDRIFIVLMNARTSSAGESFADYLRQTENTVIIGTNSAGSYSTGNINIITLPYTKVTLQCGYNLNLEPDLTTIESMGILPDIWTESDKALERALLFIKNYGLDG